MDLQSIKTKTGKTLQDFEIPEEMVAKYPDIVEMVLLSESMDDAERQYWFNLYESMEENHIERLRGILTKERTRRAEIEQKYAGGDSKKPSLTPEQIAERNKAYEVQQQKQWSQIQSQEKEVREADEEKSEEILGELDNL